MHSLHAYAIVSADDRIADAQGRFPDSLRNDADWDYFQAGLDAARATLLGRRSHEASPNHRNRLRIVMSRAADGLERREDAFWWNPARVPLGEALAAAVPDGGPVAVPGGQDVFDHVGPGGFASFHLARAHDARLPGGRGLFRACESGSPAEGLLRIAGLLPGGRIWLDEAARVSLIVFRAP